MTVKRDLLDNFETWPDHLQKSFLEIISNQVMLDAQMERIANLSYLEKLYDDFQAVLPVFSSRVNNLIEEIQDDVDSNTFLQNLADRQTIVQNLDILTKKIEALKNLMSH